MALKLGNLQVDIGADTSDLKRAEKDIKRTTKSMGSSFNALGGVIAAALSFQAVKSVVMLADSMNRLDQKIKNVSRSAKEFKIIRDGIRDIAKETGTSIESLATLSQSILIAGDSVGATSDDVLEMTANLSKLGAIGGSSAEQMKNSMLQFGQAMAGGVVRAEEFNSIVENTPVIAKTIAEGLGVSVGELRKMVIEGDVLSKDVFEALKSQTDSITEKFAKMPLTVDRATTMIANSFAVAVQEIDSGLGITESIAETMKEISGTIESDLVPVVDELYLSFKEISILMDAIVGGSLDSAAASDEWGGTLAAVKSSLTFIGQAIIQLPANLKSIFTILFGEIDQLWVTTKSLFQIIVVTMTDNFVIGMTMAIAKVKAGFFDFIAAIPKAFADVFSFFGDNAASDAFKILAADATAAGAEITAAEIEQNAIRREARDLEIEQIKTKRDIQIEASQMAIDWGIKETEDLKKQTKSRIEEMRKEIKARRGIVAGTKQDTKDKKIIGEEDSKNKEAKASNDEASTINSLGKIFGIEKEAALATATLSLGQAISKAFATKGALGFADVAAITSAFANVFSTIKGATMSAGRSHGGTASGGAAIPINEMGTPEMFINNAGRQFLLPDQSGKIVPLSGGGGGGGGGGVNVQIINNSSATVGDPIVTESGLMIEINNAVNRAVDQVNSSLASQRGATSDALRQGFAQTRNI